MYKIAFIVPYFGKLPENFPLWLLSCSCNPDIDWLIYTDDRRDFDYPSNVKAKYCTFEDIVNRAQKIFDFQITLHTPKKLCDYKVAYGEIFHEDIKEYDFWGHCDIDLMWGNIRDFLSDDILNQYEKIGYQGHCLLYKNTPEVNARYRSNVKRVPNYKKIFTDAAPYCFDEDVMDAIYNALKIPYFKETNFAHLNKYESNFFLGHLPKEDDYKNDAQVIQWENGRIYRYYLKGNSVLRDEFMYIHFFCRPMSYKAKKISRDCIYTMYADELIDKPIKLTSSYLKKKGKKKPIRFYLKVLRFNRKKITVSRILFNFKSRAQYRTRKNNAF